MPKTTVLDPAKEQEYRQWMTASGQTRAAGQAVDDNFNGTDYDYRGFYQENGPVEVAKGQHFTDKYKLPNHPTFSTESQYAVGEDAKRAGTWQGDTYLPAGYEAYSVPKEALDADALESQGFEVYSVDKSALPELVNGSPHAQYAEGFIDRAAVGIKRSLQSLIAAENVADLDGIVKDIGDARRELAGGIYRNAFGFERPLSDDERATLQKRVDDNTKVYVESLASAIGAMNKQQALPQSRARAALSAVGAQGEGVFEQVGQLAEAVAQDPAGLLGDLTAENSLQLTKLMISVAAARTAGGGRAGEMLAGFENSQFDEFGAEYVNLRTQGLSHEEAWQKAGAKSGVVALFDAASFGVTGKAVDGMIKTTIMQKVKAAARGTGEDALMGMGGEAWSQLVENGTAARVSMGDLFAEGFGELVGAPAQMLAQYPGRANELAQGEATASPAGQPVDPTVDQVFGAVEPEIVGTVDIAAREGEPTISEPEIVGTVDIAQDGEQAPAQNFAPTHDATSKAKSPQEGAASTSQRSEADSQRAGKESAAPRPQADEQTRADLESARSDIGWFEEGGKVIRDPDTDQVTGRTSWVGSELWKSRPSVGGKINEDEANGAIDKALAGDKLSAREQRWVSHVLESRAEDRRRAPYEADIPDAIRLDDSDFREAVLDPKADRELAELVQRAHLTASTEEVESALAALDDVEAKRRLVALVERGRASGHAQAQPTKDEAAAGSAPTEGQAAAATGRPTDLFGVDTERQDQLNRGNARVARKLGEGRTSPPAEQAPPGDMFRNAADAASAAAAEAQTDIEDLHKWWNKDLTEYGRRQVMNRAGVPGTGKESWRHLPASEQRKLVALRGTEIDPAAPRPGTPIDEAAHAAATSPQNDLPEPTQSQKEAGNYAKGHVRAHGLEITIENPKGSERSGVEKNGTPWSVTMPGHYGYIRGTTGRDKEHIDITLGPDPEDANNAVYVIDQATPDGLGFDEHKMFMGYGAAYQAKKAYQESFSGDFGLRMLKNAGVNTFTLDEFKRWLAEGDHQKKASDFRKHLNAQGKPQQPAEHPDAVEIRKAVDELQQALDEGQSDAWTTPQTSRAPGAGNDAVKAYEAELKRRGWEPFVRGKGNFWRRADGAELFLRSQGDTGSPIVQFQSAPDERPAKETPKPQVSANKVFTEDAAAKARAFLKSKLSSPQTGIDPEVLQAGITLAGYHIESGARTFAAYTKAMLEDLGEAVRPYLKSWYAAVKYHPGATAFAAEMDDPSAITEARETVAAKPEAKPEVAPAGTKQDQVLARFGTMLDGDFQMRDYRAAYAEIMGAKAEGAVTKRVDELVELAIVRKARDVAAQATSPQAAFDALVALYGRQPNLGVRTSTSVEQQAYSTPAPLAYLAANLAHVDAQTKVAEPTAGNGMLLITADPKNAVVNELNPVRADALRSQGFHVESFDATRAILLPQGMKSVDAVLANPPFGTVVENGSSKMFQEFWPDAKPWNGTNIDFAIAIRALQTMKKDGRAVLIVGGVNKQAKSREARSEAYNGQAKRKFYYGLYRNYRVTQHFTVAGELYEKQGAGWPVDVIVIEGRAPSTRALPAVDVPRVYTDWAALRPLVNPDVTRSANGLGTEERAAAPAPSVNNPRPPEPAAAARPSDVPDVARRPDTATGQQNVEPAGERRPADRPDGGRQPAARPGGDQVASSGAAARREQPADRPEAPGTGDLFAAEVREAGGEPGSAPSAERGSAEPAKPPARLGQRTGVALNEGPQQPYEPASRVDAIGTLVPANMRTALQDALAELQNQVGDLDAYVAKELGYKPGELGKYFAAEQVDALAEAIHQFSRGSAAIIGDQTGIGKGRVVAGLIRWALRNGHIPIFVTEKPNLYADIYRDLVDIGQKDIRPIMTNSGESIPLDEAGDFVLSSKSSAKHNELLRTLAAEGKLGERNMIFTTYNQMQTVKGQPTERMRFLEAMAPFAVILTDESHNAGGQTASGRGKKDAEADGGQKTGRAQFVRQILAKAKAAYHSSATWAKRPDVMDLYFRTDMSLAVEGDVEKLPAAIERGGVPLQQAVSAMLTKAGQYIRRERSFAGVEYNTPIVPVDRTAAEGFSAIMLAVREFDTLKAGAIERIKAQLKASAEALGSDNSVGEGGVSSTNFTSIMHNLVDQMLLALTVDSAAERAIAALKRGEKPVLTVANTMGSFIEQYVDDTGLNSGDPISLSFKDLMQRYLDRSRDVRIKSPDGTVRRHRLTDLELGKGALDQYKKTTELIAGTDSIGTIPISPIDRLHNLLRKAGYTTSEITGRTQIIDYSEDTPVYRIRPPSETSIAGRRRTIIGFNNGTIDAVILNQAGATGLSLHASEKFKNQSRRRMIIVQPERNIDTHMQMLGRVHRTGQVIAPAFDQLVADIPAVKRPAAVLAKKMASLNANTTAARESQFTSKETLDFMNVYGDEVVAQLMEDMPEIHELLGEPLKPDEEGLLREDAARKVTGRLPLLSVREQEDVYELIGQGYAEALARADALGENALEAKTLPLDARTKQRNVIKESANSASPFADGAYADTVDVKRLGKPFTSEQVLEKVAATLDMPKDTPLAKMEKEGQVKATGLRLVIAKRFEEYRQEQLAALKREEASDKEVQAELLRLQFFKDRWDQKMSQLHVGGQYELYAPEGGTFYGVLTEIRHKNKIKNPVAAGAWIVHFAVADGMRTVSMPLSKLTFAAPGSIKFFSGVYLRPTKEHGLLRRPVMQLFDDGQSESRETRVIVTGNLLAGFAQISKGRIVNYTDNKGELRQGIFLPRSFDLEEFSDSMPIELTPSQARELLRKQTKAVITTADHAIQVKYTDQGLMLSVSKSKAEGGRYYLDPDLRKITGDFVSMSNSMRVVLSPPDAQAAMELIGRKFEQRFIAETFKDEARMVGGTKMAARTVPVEQKEPVEGHLDVSPGPAPGEKTLNQSEMQAHLSELFQDSPTQAVAIDPRNPPAKWVRHMEYLAEIGAKGWRGFATTDPETGRPTILMRAGQYRSLGELERKAIHEAVHHGLAAYFGKAFTLFARRTFNSQGRDLFKDVIAKYFPAGNFNDKSDTHVAIAVNEYLAQLGESVAANTASARLIRLWDSFLGWLQETLKSFRVGVTFNNRELRNIVRASAKRGMEGKSAPAANGVTDLGREMGGRDNDTRESQRQFWNWITRGQPLDRVFRVAFTPFGAASIDRTGVWHVNPAFKAATQRAAERLSRSATRRFTWLRPMFGKAQWALEDTWGFRLKDTVASGLLNRHGTPEPFVERQQQWKNEIIAGLLDVKDMADRVMESVQTRDEAQMLAAVMRGEEVTDEQVRAVAGPIVDAIDSLGSELVNVGLLSREAFERNRRRYYHRSYLPHEKVFGALGQWADQWSERRRVKVQGDVFKGRGVSFKVTTEELQKALPQDFWGQRYEAKKGDVRLGGTKWKLLDRTREPTDEAQIEGLPGTSQKKARVLDRVYWPADEPVPQRFAGWTDRGTYEVRSISPGKVTLWRDWNEQERTRMGEILDGRYVAVQTMSMMVKDLATGRMYSDIAKNPEWAQAEEPMKPDGTPAWVDAKEISITPWSHKTYAGIDWVKVPSTKIPGSQTFRYGQLAGMYVQAPIWRDMSELEYLQLPSTWKALLGMWKANKTARSPVASFNNVMGNFVLMDWSDIRWSDWLKGVRSYMKSDQHYQDALRHGVFGASAREIDTDLKQRILDPILRQLKNEAADAGAGGRLRWISRFLTLLKSGDRKMLEFYQMQDDVFRMGAYTKYIGEGLSPAEAATRAKRDFLDTSEIAAPWVNWARTTVFPFIGWSYLAIPRLANTLYNKPWKIAKLATIAAVANAVSYALMDDDDEDRERRLMDEQFQGRTALGTPRMIRIPRNDQYGNPGFLDTRRMVPLGDLFDPAGTTVDWAPALFQVGGPLVIAAELGMNMNTYKDEPIYDKDIDTGLEKAGKFAMHAWKGFMPNAPWIPGSYSFENLADSVTGAKNGAYQEIPTLETLIGAFGPKIRYQNTEFNAERARLENEAVTRKLNAAEKRAEREFAKGRLDEDELRDAVVTLEEKKARAARRLSEKINGPQEQ